MDPLELLSGKMAVYSQPVLAFHGSVRKPDVVIVTDHGDVVVVEVKRLVNAELRDGRRAIAQGVEYASLLSSAQEADLVRSLTGGRHSSWNLLCRHDLGQDASPSQVANVLRNRIGDGDIHLVIACEEAPPDPRHPGSRCCQLGPSRVRFARRRNTPDGARRDDRGAGSDCLGPLASARHGDRASDCRHRSCPGRRRR